MIALKIVVNGFNGRFKLLIMLPHFGDDVGLNAQHIAPGLTESIAIGKDASRTGRRLFNQLKMGCFLWRKCALIPMPEVQALQVLITQHMDFPSLATLLLFKVATVAVLDSIDMFQNAFVYRSIVTPCHIFPEDEGALPAPNYRRV